MQDTDQAKAHVLEKYKKRGFHHLTLEELAITQICPTWAEEFKAATAEDWSSYQEKAADRLARAKFNIKWLSREDTGSFGSLFAIVSRGDLKMLEEYLRVNDLKACMRATDDSKKTCLHIACREGHADVVEYLVNKRWAIEARDKLLATPLQMACSAGHANIVGFLLLKGADPRAKDSLGRSSLLFAVCSPNTEAVEALLKHEVGLIDSKDYTGRSSLHYAIFNPHPRQVDIARTLLEAGMPVDIPDNELKTPLHHACESSKPRGIRLLLKWGANTQARDKAGKTPADLASNQSIKQLVTLYAKPKPEDTASAKSSRITSEKLPRLAQKPYELRAATPIATTSQPHSTFREKLMNLLRKVQEAGVTSNQHVKKPSVFSGAWVDGLVNTTALLNELASTTPGEAVIKVFNVLFPYPKALPEPQEDEVSGLEFFGTTAYKTPRQEAVYIQDDGKVIRLQQQLDTAEQHIRELQQALTGKDSVVQELQIALKTKGNELNNLQDMLKDLKDKLQAALKMVPAAEDIKAKQVEREKLKEQIEVYRVKFEDCEKKLKDAKTLAESLKVELDQRPLRKDVEDLKINIEKIQADDRNLRFKAGQAFLSSLEDQDDSEAAAPESHLQDDEVLKRLEYSLSGNSPSFKQRLIDADSNKDGKVTRGELTKVLATLSLPPQDIIVLLRVAGLRKGVFSVSIEVLASMLASREQRKDNLEILLFSKLAEVFEKSSMTIEQAFDYIDVNKDGSINFQELSEVCDTLHMNISREDRHALFAVLDQDHSGTISLLEFKSRLENAPAMPKPAKAPQTRPPNNRYEEAKDLTPASSERGIAIIDKQPSANATSITNNKSKEPTKQPVQVAPAAAVKELPRPASTNKKLSGNLVIGVVRGKDLGPGSYTVQLRIEGAEKVLKTPLLSGANPEWKYKGRIRLYDTSTSQISQEVIAEVSGDKGLVASTQVPWIQTLDFPNAWAVKSEYSLSEPNGRKHGSLFIHLMWCPKDSIRVEGAGVLSIQVVSYSGFPKSQLQFTIGSSKVISGLEKDSVAMIKDLILKKNEPVPSLKCTVLNAANREEILWRNLSIEVALTTPEWTQPLLVPLNGDFKLTLKFWWLPQTAEDEKRFRAVVKIQAMFRGRKARKNLPVLLKPRRKLVGRRVIACNKKYYLLSVIEEQDNLLLELHNADDSDRPMYEVSSYMRCQKQAVDEIFRKVKVSGRNEIVMESAPQEEVCGSLGIEICSCTCPVKSYARIEFGKAFVHSPAGPPWGKKIMIPEIAYTQMGPVKVTLFSVEKRDELCKGLFDWAQSVKNPDKWTAEVISEVGKYSMTLKFIWSLNKQAKPETRVVLDKTEEGIKKKSIRTLLGRKGIMRNKRYYLLSIYDTAGLKQIELHVADDPNFPMYEVVDKADLSPLLDLENVLAKLEISKDRKLIIPKYS